MCSEKGKTNWEELLANMTGVSLVGSHGGKKEGQECYAHVRDSQMYP